ncbi:NADPH-dependent F420 reductase [Sinorhizobium meliloti]|uniref:NADPH-dependent F420 reductase n=1 Tax=Rhizobium meliloti TaxID=382 RepID=UPI0022796474|nr:NADPH-dependent F420 reductase [Sinorhizobium meliloti]WQO97913.1 NADPH-dependent F420 reductase [Sinorhizobium meliloti]
MQPPHRRFRMTTYAIIGAGAIGSALAERFTAAQIPAIIANSRGPASLSSVTDRFGASVKAVELKDALQADVVILAVPYDSIADIVTQVSDWGGRIVVDASNAIDFPAFKPRDLGGRLSTEIVSELVPGAKVVKAFNTLPAAVLAADPDKGTGSRVLFLSGNHSDANRQVAELISSLGFAPVDLGTLAASGPIQQFGRPLVSLNLLKD